MHPYVLPSPSYAPSHSDWDERPRHDSDPHPSFLQMVFGSCSGVVNAASLVFSSSQSCSVGRGSDTLQRKRSRRTKSPSLRKSEEVLEIPEFLAADLEQGRNRHVPPTDDVSALSSFTLEEMAMNNVVADRWQAAAVFSRKSDGPPSLTMTDPDEDVHESHSEFFIRYDNPGSELAPLTGMVLTSTGNFGSNAMNNRATALGVDCKPTAQESVAVF